MAQLKILQSVSGTDFSWSAGDIVEVSDEDAAKWADGYRAVLEDGTVITPYVEPDAPEPIVVEVITGDTNPADEPETPEDDSAADTPESLDDVETPEDDSAADTPESLDDVETPEDDSNVETPEKPRGGRKARSA